MTWQKFTQNRRMDHETPIVSIGTTHFRYNAVATRVCELKKFKRVIYHLDELNRKIGFEFVSEYVDDSYSLSFKKGGNVCSASQSVVSRYPWIKAVASLPDFKERRSRLRHDRNLWAAQLCPAFENRVLRTEIKSIPSDSSGIYRYTNAGVIVYIGKGNIRNRLNEIGREQWQFDSIEYSILAGEDKQYEWESYWIGRFKDTNNNSLPVYNAIAGRNSYNP